MTLHYVHTDIDICTSVDVVSPPAPAFPSHSHGFCPNGRQSSPVGSLQFLCFLTVVVRATKDGVLLSALSSVSVPVSLLTHS